MQKSSKHNMDIVKQLEIHRLENRLTLQKLADELKISFSTISRWFSGKTKPNKIQQYHIEKLLKGVKNDQRKK